MFEVSEEEKRLSEEIWAIEQQIARLKRDRYFYDKEKEGHNAVSHTEIVPAVIFTLLCLFNVVLFVLDIVIGRGTMSTKPDSFLDPNVMTKFSISMALAVGTPALIIIFGILAFINIRKLFYQVSNNAAVRARAEDIGVTNFRREEERLDVSYNITNDRIRGLEILLKEKKDALEVLQTERAIAERKAREERVAQGEQISYEIVKHEKRVE